MRGIVRVELKHGHTNGYLGEMTHVKPVDRLIPARKAVMSNASKPRWNNLPNIELNYALSCDTESGIKKQSSQ